MHLPAKPKTHYYLIHYGDTSCKNRAQRREAQQGIPKFRKSVNPGSDETIFSFIIPK